MEDPALTPLLQILILESAAPLVALEEQAAYAIDATGFATEVYGTYCEHKHGATKVKRHKQYVSVRRIAFLTSEGHSRRCSRGGQDGTVDTRGMGGASRAVEEQWADSRGVRV
jgi:hypothetical protein